MSRLDERTECVRLRRSSVAACRGDNQTCGPSRCPSRQANNDEKNRIRMACSAPSIVITTPVRFKPPDGSLNQSAQRNKPAAGGATVILRPREQHKAEVIAPPGTTVKLLKDRARKGADHPVGLLPI